MVGEGVGVRGGVMVMVVVVMVVVVMVVVVVVVVVEVAGLRGASGGSRPQPTP
jgi:hypothetical protein